ncbi:patatin-like phospholipase family protein [Fibrobacter sp. UBA2449]|uniref:patatin-like phospholipase family protein n=1 Tax=Fibrobacter sp. UBA2449 TaxID=1946529 RepID=UPI0025BD41A9|nr:patatin family protein [Fibrobacter sp. UBA2449]
MSKKGLVLEGGAMRGLFTCGILDTFMEEGIDFDGAVGISAGACFGCNLKSRQPGRALRYNLRFAGDKRYCSFRSLFQTGDIYNADFCYHKIPQELDPFDFETLKKNPMEFYMGATDIETGKAVFPKLIDGSDKDLEWMRASASMPLAAKIVEIDDGKYMDGGIADSIPLQFMQSVGYDRNIVILTQPRNYVKGPNKLMPLMRFIYRKYPKFIEAMAHRHEMYNAETRFVFEQEKLGNTLVLCPEAPLGISRIEKNRSELQRVYDMGKRIASERMNEIKNFISRD